MVLGTPPAEAARRSVLHRKSALKSVCYCVLLRGQPGVERVGADGSEWERQTFTKPLQTLNELCLLAGFAGWMPDWLSVLLRGF